MDNVWIVTEQMWYEYTEIVGVFSSKESGIRCIEQKIGNRMEMYNQSSFIDHEYYESVRFSSPQQHMTFEVKQYGVK